VIRNPWDFYVSYYAFQKALIDSAKVKLAKLSAEEYELLVKSGVDPCNGIDILFENLSNNGTLDFVETTTNLLNLSTTGDQLNPVLEFMPTELGRRGKSTPLQYEGFRGMNVTRDDLENIRDTSEGLYTFLFRRMYDCAEGLYTAKLNNLRQDLISFFTALKIEIEPSLKEYILTAEPDNISHHDYYPAYYTPSLKNLVGKRDAFLIENFGFEF
jgi:hypothetical protein